MTRNPDVLRDIPDTKPVRVFLPLQDSKERFRLQAIYQKSDGARFRLLFQPGTLPVEALDTTQTCIISIDMGGPNISLEANISTTSKQILEMVAQKSVSHDQMRDFFRVDATAQVISRSFQPEFYGKKGEPWSMQGKTIDISGSGILATFAQKPPADDQVHLEITLPTTPPDLVKTVAQPVRVLQIADDTWEVAYHFIDIEDEDRDKIIGCCLVIQRRLLRLKVQVPDITNT